MECAGFDTAEAPEPVVAAGLRAVDIADKVTSYEKRINLFEPSWVIFGCEFDWKMSCSVKFHEILLVRGYEIGSSGG